jgi:hypothetical protein
MPVEEPRALSAILRVSGETLSRIGRAIERSQIEDGDPPYRIPALSHQDLVEAIESAAGCLKQLSL